MPAVKNVKTDWVVLPADLTGLIEVEKSCFDNHWTAKDFKSCLEKNNGAGLTAKVNGKVVGFVIYEIFNRRIQILNLAVIPAYRRKKIGTCLIRAALQALAVGKRERAVAEVRESNLDTQLFLKANDFKAFEVIPDYFSDTGEDAYAFEYWCPESSIK